jgi:hypothetical protein
LVYFLFVKQFWYFAKTVSWGSGLTGNYEGWIFFQLLVQIFAAEQHFSIHLLFFLDQLNEF